MFWQFKLATVALIVLLSGCNRSARDNKVYVLAASSTEQVFRELEEVFESQHPGIDIVISTGPSNALAQQIINGSRANIFFSASPVWTSEIAQSDLTLQPIDIVGNQLVLVTSPQSEIQFESFQQFQEAVSTNDWIVSIGGNNVPLGEYSQQALGKNLFELLVEQKRLVRGTDARSTLAYVARGEVDCGLVYSTDARSADQVQLLLTIPADQHDEIVYSILNTNDLEPQATNEFLKFIKSPEARSIWEQAGFKWLDSQ